MRSRFTRGAALETRLGNAKGRSGTIVEAWPLELLTLFSSNLHVDYCRANMGLSELVLTQVSNLTSLANFGNLQSLGWNSFLST